MIESKNYININELDKLNQKTFNKCLENYDTYSMETDDNLNEKIELEMLLKNKFLNLKETAIKNNSVYINNLKKKITSQYELEMKKVGIFCSKWFLDF